MLAAALGLFGAGVAVESVESFVKLPLPHSFSSQYGHFASTQARPALQAGGNAGVGPASATFSVISRGGDPLVYGAVTTRKGIRGVYANTLGGAAKQPIVYAREWLAAACVLPQRGAVSRPKARYSASAVIDADGGWLTYSAPSPSMLSPVDGEARAVAQLLEIAQGCVSISLPLSAATMDACGGTAVAPPPGGIVDAALAALVRVCGAEGLHLHLSGSRPIVGGGGKSGAAFTERLCALPPSVALRAHPLSIALTGHSVVVTGGTGAIGSLASLFLREAGAGAILLLGRSGRLAQADAAPRGDIRLTVARCDTSCPAELGSVVGAAFARTSCAPPLASLFHAAGVTHDMGLSNQMPSAVRGVFAPKLAAVEPLSALCQLQPLASAALFSSISAVFGAGGQANYAAVNSALDGLAARLSSGGIPAKSLNLGAWVGLGAANGKSGMIDDGLLPKMVAAGAGLLTPAQGLQVLSLALALGASRESCCLSPGLAGLSAALAGDFTWARFRHLAHAGREENFLEEVTPPTVEEPSDLGLGPNVGAAGAPVPAAAHPSAGRDPRLLRLAMLAPATRRALLTEQVLSAVASVLGVEPAADAPLVDAGLDSFLLSIIICYASPPSLPYHHHHHSITCLLLYPHPSHSTPPHLCAC